MPALGRIVLGGLDRPEPFRRVLPVPGVTYDTRGRPAGRFLSLPAGRAWVSAVRSRVCFAMEDGAGGFLGPPRVVRP
ncbi:hypothetical protein GCM10018773_21960 [Streptomyces candidus]|nr:hypothetical protein GCM10018773_21960 [Streptomyces candidus]